MGTCHALSSWHVPVTLTAGPPGPQILVPQGRALPRVPGHGGSAQTLRGGPGSPAGPASPARTHRGSLSPRRLIPACVLSPDCDTGVKRPIGGDGQETVQPGMVTGPGRSGTRERWVYELRDPSGWLWAPAARAEPQEETQTVPGLGRACPPQRLVVKGRASVIMRRAPGSCRREAAAHRPARTQQISVVTLPSAWGLLQEGSDPCQRRAGPSTGHCWEEPGLADKRGTCDPRAEAQRGQKGQERSRWGLSRPASRVY